MMCPSEEWNASPPHPKHGPAEPVDRLLEDARRGDRDLETLLEDSLAASERLIYTTRAAGTGVATLSSVSKGSCLFVLIEIKLSVMRGKPCELAVR